MWRPIEEAMSYAKYERMTRDEWKKCIAHDHGNPSRPAAFAAISEFFNGELKELVEIGFCSCFDFEAQFKEWHDVGLISYTGYDTWKPFVLYALAEFPTYDFRWGGPLDMDECDISYARHVYMTMPPELTCLHDDGPGVDGADAEGYAEGHEGSLRCHLAHAAAR